MIKVDVKKCIGCGLCESICPEVFKLEEIKGEMKAKVTSQKSIPCVKEAIDSCPTEAITK